MWSFFGLFFPSLLILHAISFSKEKHEDAEDKKRAKDKRLVAIRIPAGHKFEGRNCGDYQPHDFYYA
jgi:hypothetical protein